MPVFLVMIQFDGQFLRQTESAGKTVQGPFSGDMILGTNDPAVGDVLVIEKVPEQAHWMCPTHY